MLTGVLLPFAVDEGAPGGERPFVVDLDCVVIDEAGQLGLGPASLVLKSLRNTGRIIIAGDNEQLAPILSTAYPQVGPRLFGSILDALMPPTTQHEGRNQAHTAPTETTDHSMIVQLTENFR